MIKAGEELLRLQAENQKLRKELAEHKDFLDLETLEIYTENKRLKEGIKQAREEIESNVDYDYIPYTGGYTTRTLKADDVLEILDNLIAESEG